MLDCVWNVMAHAQKAYFVFRRNGRVNLNRRGRQFSPLLAAEVYASAVVMLDTPCSEVVWRVLTTHSIRKFPPHFPSRVSPCAIRFQLDSTTNGVVVSDSTSDHHQELIHCALGTGICHTGLKTAFEQDQQQLLTIIFHCHSFVPFPLCLPDKVLSAFRIMRATKPATIIFPDVHIAIWRCVIWYLVECKFWNSFLSVFSSFMFPILGLDSLAPSSVTT